MILAIHTHLGIFTLIMKVPVKSFVEYCIYTQHYYNMSLQNNIAIVPENTQEKQ